jgi:PilZ domain
MHLVEHRLSTRVPVRLEALLQQPAAPACFVRLRDLSRYGAYAETWVAVPRHRRVWIHLRTPGSRKPAVIRATVVRAQHNGIGLEFDDYGVEAAAIIDNLIQEGGNPAALSG